MSSLVSKSSAMRDPSFVVFSDDWGQHPSSSQHIFRHIAREHRVLWVNTIGMRNPALTLADLRKAWRKLSRMGKSASPNAEQAEGNAVEVCQPVMLPYARRSLVRALNARSVTRTVEAQVRRLQLDEPVVVTTVPNFGDYPRLLSGSTVVYYCVDDFSLWPGMDGELVREMESRLIARADILVASSSTLYDRLSSSGKPAILLSHGVDVDLFSSRSTQKHECLAGIPRPRAGFFGLIDGRIDLHLMSAVAESSPEFSFVFAGPRDIPVDKLASLRNVHFTGPIAYSELPALIAGIDVLLIPYASGALADSLSPLKLKEYLATGKPILSTSIAEVAAWREYVAIAETLGEWQHGLSEALGKNVEVRRRSILPALEKESWAGKAKTLLEVCEMGRLNRTVLTALAKHSTQHPRAMTG
jgi:hypothetical protein